MKQLLIGLIVLFASSPLFAQQEKSFVKKGNDLYQQQRYKEAAELYTRAVEKKKESLEGQFNLGDAHYKQKEYDKAAEQFTKIAESNKDKAIIARAYHNLGNTYLQNNKLEESIEAYKKALLNNPKDDETRYNLVYALDKLKKQQQQNKDNKDKNKNNQNQDKKNQDKPDKNNQDQNKKDQNKKDRDKQQQQQPQPDKLSKEDAQRMLDALNNQEKETQEKLKKKKGGAVNGKPLKDW